MFRRLAPSEVNATNRRSVMPPIAKGPTLGIDNRQDLRNSLA